MPASPAEARAFLAGSPTIAAFHWLDDDGRQVRDGAAPAMLRLVKRAGAGFAHVLIDAEDVPGLADVLPKAVR